MSSVIDLPKGFYARVRSIEWQICVRDNKTSWNL